MTADANLKTVEVAFELGIAWWWWPYVYGLITVGVLMGAEPDWTKVEETLIRAIRWRYVGAWRWRRLF